MAINDKPSYAFLKDWFTFVFTIPDAKTVSEHGLAGLDNKDVKVFVKYCLRALQLDDAKWIETNGLYTYNHGLQLSGENSITVGYSDPIKFGDTVMVQMSGAGYDFWRKYLADKGYSIKQLERIIYNDPVVTMRPSRIDATLDLWNFPKEYSPAYVNEVTQAGYFIGNSRTKATWVHSFSAGKPTIKDDSRYSTKDEGSTLYFGRGGERQLRIYNKLAERLSKTGSLYRYKSWYRWEFEIRGRAANDFWCYYMDHGQSMEKAWRFWLATNYRWVVPTGKKQVKKSRYPSAKWYLQLIEGFIDAVPIRHKARMRNFEKSRDWVQKSVYPTLKAMYDYKCAKYIQNGLSEEDAKRSALQDAWNDIIEPHKNTGINYEMVANYFVGEGVPDEIIIEKMKNLAREQKDHIDGV